MIKFFRHIRKSLIQENNMGKYFKYAIGEVILVVIGILIAVQINNWNESRKNNVKEQVVLKELLAEMEINEAKIDHQTQRLNKIIQLQRNYIQELAAGTLTMERMEELHSGPSLTVGTVNPSFGAINTILSTGDIGLIRNDSLRNALSNWKDILLDFTEDEQFHLDFFFRELHPFLRENFLLTKSEGQSLIFHDIDNAEIEKAYLRMANNNKYRSYIIDNLNWLKGNMNNYENTLSKLRNLMEHIKHDIN